MFRTFRSQCLVLCVSRLGNLAIGETSEPTGDDWPELEGIESSGTDRAKCRDVAELGAVAGCALRYAL